MVVEKGMRCCQKATVVCVYAPTPLTYRLDYRPTPADPLVKKSPNNRERIGFMLGLREPIALLALSSYY
jgi:hypothetical protein